MSIEELKEKYESQIIEITQMVNEIAREEKMTIFIEAFYHEDGRNSADAVFLDHEGSHQVRLENIYTDSKILPTKVWRETFVKED